MELAGKREGSMTMSLTDKLIEASAVMPLGVEMVPSLVIRGDRKAT